MNLLHIDSSALGEFSVSRELSKSLTDALRTALPAARYRYRDLAASPPAHVSGALLAALRAPDAATAEIAPEVALTDELLAEFLAADVIVVGAPMYNFSVPTPLKAWIDRVAQAGKTFRYTAEGPVGLAGGKRVIIVSSRGSLISGTAAETALDHQEAYLTTVFGFFGIDDVRVLRAEGIGLGPDARRASLERAHAAVDAIIAEVAAPVAAAA